MQSKIEKDSYSLSELSSDPHALKTSSDETHLR